MTPQRGDREREPRGTITAFIVILLAILLSTLIRRFGPPANETVILSLTGAPLDALAPRPTPSPRPKSPR